MLPATDWSETIPADEAERFERYAQEMRALQGARARAQGMGRALHARAQAGVEATFEVLPDLPEHARVAFFGSPATYRAYVRFSNGSGVRQPDRKPDVRGVAIKVFGIPGKKIIPGLENARTQDFLLIHTPAMPVRNAGEFFALVRAAKNPLLLLPRLIGGLGFVRALQVLPRLVRGLSTPIGSLATTRYFSAVPIRFGAYAVKLALAPHAAGPGDGAKAPMPEDLGAELALRLLRGPVVYDVRVQFYCDQQRTPIEDASVEWLEEHAPFVTVARLTLLEQDVGSARGQRLAEVIESLSFDPWHALEELRPLGNVMRARSPSYRESILGRGAAPEPDEPVAID
jgi:Catalase